MTNAAFAALFDSKQICHQILFTNHKPVIRTRGDTHVWQSLCCIKLLPTYPATMLLVEKRHNDEQQGSNSVCIITLRAAIGSRR